MESVGARGWQRGPAVVPEASAGPWGHGETCACLGGGKAEMPVQTAAAGAKRGNQGGAWNSCKLRELLPPPSHPGCRLPFQVAHKHLLSQKPRLKNRQAINYLIFLFFSWPVLPVVVGFVCGVKITENKVGNYQGRGRGALWMNVRPGGRGGVQSRTLSCVIFLREQMTATSIYLGDV